MQPFYKQVLNADWCTVIHILVIQASTAHFWLITLYSVQQSTVSADEGFFIRFLQNQKQKVLSGGNAGLFVDPSEHPSVDCLSSLLALPLWW